MLFNSLQYLLIFLPLALTVFLVLGRLGLASAQRFWLVGASLVFYASWEARFLALIVGSVLVNFLFGRALAAAAAVHSRWLLAAGVVFNLALLAYFKYVGFFLENLGGLLGWLLPIPDITLPLAISFFTFQQIAYLVDVWRGEVRDYSLSHYALFVTFFPQLVAGPIVHHREMMPQFDSLAGSRDRAMDLKVGLTIICLGLFKKVVLADNLAVLADPVFAAGDSGAAVSTVMAWVGVAAFSGQIYFDFSGYSDIAIGSARLFGIRLPENFRSPYKAASIIEFWHRWHITLSRFLRDYLYIPLGGNRRGRVRRHVNLVATMLLGGLWHGAHWNFVIWGGLHGAYLVVNHGWRFALGGTSSRTWTSSAAYRLSALLLTLGCVMVAWVFFRAASTQGALALTSALFSWSPLPANSIAVGGLAEAAAPFRLMQALLPAVTGEVYVAALLTLAALVAMLAPNTQEFMAGYDPVLASREWPAHGVSLRWQPSVGWALVIALLAYIVLLELGGTTEFIYFQF